MEVNGAFSSVKLNKICSKEGLTFNLCISLTHFMEFENTEIETSHSRNVCLIRPTTELHRHFENVDKRTVLRYSLSITEWIVSSVANQRRAFVIER